MNAVSTASGVHPGARVRAEAFFIDGKFAGWGGLQPEDGDADVAVVLHPDYWGKGRAIYEEIRADGLRFRDRFVAPSRRSLNRIMRLGFEPDGERFFRYRLSAERYRRKSL